MNSDNILLKIIMYYALSYVCNKYEPNIIASHNDVKKLIDLISNKIDYNLNLRHPSRIVGDDEYDQSIELNDEDYKIITKNGYLEFDILTDDIKDLKYVDVNDEKCLFSSIKIIIYKIDKKKSIAKQTSDIVDILYNDGVFC